MNVLALCAGVGAMELGLELATGGRARAVCYVEREAYAAACLVARMEDKALARAPIWDDLTTFDCEPWRGVVGCVTAGLPCQPYSVAGKKQGHADDRALWPHFVRIVREVRPSCVFLENVPQFRKHFEPVWQGLQDLGFVWAPPLLQTASELGAPHIRERFFAFAAHPDRARLEGWGLPRRERADQRTSGPVRDETANPNDSGLDRKRSGWVFDEERATLRHDPDRCGDGCRTCGTQWGVESPPVRMDARTPFWVDELRAVGNVGAPPVAYARAWQTLTTLWRP